MEHKITIETIETKEFKHERDGYSQMEVDTFLDEICDEMDLLQQEISTLTQQLNEAKSLAASAPAATEAADKNAVFGILDMAQKVKDETIAEAQKKAASILAEADEQVKARLGNLMDEKDSLTRQVEALKQNAASYRSKFVEMLQAQQEALDKIAEV